MSVASIFIDMPFKIQKHFPFDGNFGSHIDRTDAAYALWKWKICDANSKQQRWLAASIQVNGMWLMSVIPFCHHSAIELFHYRFSLFIEWRDRKSKIIVATMYLCSRVQFAPTPYIYYNKWNELEGLGPCQTKHVNFYRRQFNFRTYVNASHVM